MDNLSFKGLKAGHTRREDGEAIESAASGAGIAVHWAAAKASADMVRKGSAVLVEGRLAIREYKDRGGSPWGWRKSSLPYVRAC